MHRNVARAYDYLKREHDRIRAAHVKTLAQKDLWSAAHSVQTLITIGTSMKCFSTNNVFPAPNAGAVLT